MNELPLIKHGATDGSGDGPTSMRRVYVRRFAPRGVVILLGVVFFGVTSPRAVPSILLIAGFIVLGSILYALLQLVCNIGILGEKLKPSTKRSVVLTGTILPVLLLMMQSVGQLTLRDVVTLSGLFLIGAFYLSRSRRTP